MQKGNCFGIYCCGIIYFFQNVLKTLSDIYNWELFIIAVGDAYNLDFQYLLSVVEAYGFAWPRKLNNLSKSKIKHVDTIFFFMSIFVTWCNIPNQCKTNCFIN